jgi:hypothetical protein
MGIILVQIYLSHTKYSSFVDFLKRMDQIKFQISQISPKFTILLLSLEYTSCQFFEMQKIVFCNNNFEGL